MSDVEGLDVYLYGSKAGVLERQTQARLRFVYDQGWVEEGRSPLSLSLSVRKRPFEHEECAPFFEGLLLELGDPVMRTPLRNMRAGLRDGLDARKIASDWGARAAALLTAGL